MGRIGIFSLREFGSPEKDEHECPLDRHPYRIIYAANKPISENMTEVAVFVDSRGGNTRKVADAIADELGVTVGDITAPLPVGANLLFLGSGTYGGAPGIDMMKFVTDNTFTGRKVALFGTSMADGGAQKMIAAMEDALIRKGATVLGSYHCKGKFIFFNRGRPNTEDLDNAKKFARDISGSP
jgi:flavodoxin